MSSLEDRYRRLVRWYPADHRRDHEDEMVGVLLTAAGPGRERPSPRETADLMRGAVRLHLRRARGGWGDAVALVAVLSAAMIAAWLPIFLVGLSPLASYDRPDSVLLAGAGSVIVAAAWFGRGKKAVAAVWSALALTVATQLYLLFYPHSYFIMQPVLTAAMIVVLPAVCAVAVSFPGALDRGRALAGRPRLLRFWLSMALLPVLLTLQPTVAVSIPAFWAGRAMGHPTARRAALLLAVPGLISVGFPQPFLAPRTFLLWDPFFLVPMAIQLLAPTAVFALTAAATVARTRKGTAVPAS
ncbi:hypothetical protein [Spirillospora sp. CA-294931]|uniref:hypothetical protein n=1 Tax=Spirillospora sp. CA-294931 TaxID=3240042 RepID=UPI003D8A1E14